MPADTTSTLHGILAAFSDPRQLQMAFEQSRTAGYRELEAYTPFPVEALQQTLTGEHSRLPLIVLTCFILGAVGMYALQYYSAVIAYPVNIGGRPLHSWPAFLMASFALGILGGACGAFFGMLWLNGLPRYHHPVFDAPHFSLAGEDAFYLCILARDPLFEKTAVQHHLQQFSPVSIDEVCAP